MQNPKTIQLTEKGEQFIDEMAPLFAAMAGVGPVDLAECAKCIDITKEFMLKQMSEDGVMHKIMPPIPVPDPGPDAQATADVANPVKVINP